YTLKLRVAAVFILLTTSTIGILAPIFLRNFKKVASDGLVFTIFKQFGTGVIISTVFIHLLMHAVLQFLNPCVGEMEYEGTVMAIAMGGAFFSFLVDYAGVQYLRRYRKHQDSRPQNESHDRQRMDEEKLSVFIMEGGIIFHSILVGVLLAVTPDTELPTIFAVVLIHQLFEGIALGARIAPLENVANRKKILMAIAFSVTAPLGMAIGIGVRKSFNSNDKSTIVTLGTMDALSAGVLAWVAFVELWSKDWLHGEMRDAPAKKQIVGMISLVLGIAIMSFLGKWA
ncbi:Zinc/iron permease, partial [Tothia fuscella]